MTYKISVEFCTQWNFAPKAASFAEGLLTHFRREITSFELIPSTGGVFEVTVNGVKRYSKLETGKFPNVDEFIAELEAIGEK